MSIMERLLARLGFVKLGKYGLTLTPDGRIITLKPAVLDDGSGGRVVGWRDGDLAELALPRLELAPAPRPAVIAPTFPAVAPAHVASTSLAAAARVTAPIAPPAPVEVAAESDEDQDEWEWNMAMARARAVAEENEVAAKAPPPRPVARPAAKSPTMPPAMPAPRAKRPSDPALVHAAAAAIATAKQAAALAATKVPAVRPATQTDAPRPRRLVPEAPPTRAAKQTMMGVRPAEQPRPLPLPPSDQTAQTQAAPPARAARPAPALVKPRPPTPADEVTKTEVTKVEEPTRGGEETRKDVKAAPLPRLSARFAV